MGRQLFKVGSAGLAVLSLAISARSGLGQGPKSETRAALPVAAAGDQVILKREATRIEPAQKYRVTLSLEPVRTVTVTAPFDGVIRLADGAPNSRLQAQMEIARLDNTAARITVQRAEAALRIAIAEQKLAADQDELHKQLAQARVDLAKADVELAKHVLEQASLRTPFAGELQRLLVTEGQYVRTGDPIAVVVDQSKLRVEVPIERSQAVQGKSLPIKVESADVDGKIEAVLPLGDRFGAIRDVFESVAAATVVIDNSDGKFKPGQTVYVPLIPRQPVAEVPTSALGNVADGQRKIQVVRHSVIRDIPVVVMGSVGISRVFVSGAFAEGDEVLYESSHQLADGFVLKAAAAPVAAATPGGTAPAPTNPGATKPAVGF